ncbi:hypothetical protein [Paraburkholderia fungorum]|uniref:hypothetical protein n=1 Tax=Paraburkholderia fungorum TaxID=134537 RepID=UPI00402B114D
MHPIAAQPHSIHSIKSSRNDFVYCFACHGEYESHIGDKMPQKKTLAELDAQVRAIDEAHTLISLRLFEALLAVDPAGAKKALSLLNDHTKDSGDLTVHERRVANHLRLTVGLFRQTTALRESAQLMRELVQRVRKTPD